MAEVTGLRPFSSDIERKNISPKVVLTSTPKADQQVPNAQKVTVEDKFGVSCNTKVDSSSDEYHDDDTIKTANSTVTNTDTTINTDFVDDKDEDGNILSYPETGLQLIIKVQKGNNPSSRHKRLKPSKRRLNRYLKHGESK